MSAHFVRAYVEITNVCGLTCSFCPPKTLPPLTMPLALFERVLEQLRPYTREVALHVVGDPLTLGHLHDYLDLCGAYEMRVMLTTSGFYTRRHSVGTLTHSVIRQLNFSLNSFNKNPPRDSFEHYMEPIIEICRAKIDQGGESFINLRLWNLDDMGSEAAFNERVIDYLEKAFTCTLDTGGSLRLSRHVLLHYDRYFEWPDLALERRSDGTCHGLSKQIGVLADGRVVPCCLDKDGVMTLGSLADATLEAILQTPRAQAIVQGFKEGRAVEALCQSCGYKERFGLKPRFPQ
ncbi:MAG: radical SAM/SPASM domain-containing protein [Campylobacterales bacterium]|nr:radical SAM/SPASM domain-containing protein [Campylobacterales bacterium]